MVDLNIFVQWEPSESDPTLFGRDCELSYYNVPDRDYELLLNKLRERPEFELWEHGDADNQFFNKEAGVLLTVTFEFAEPAKHIDPDLVIDRILVGLQTDELTIL